MLVAEGAAHDTREKAAAESDEIIAQARLRAEEVITQAQKEHKLLLEDVERLRDFRTELVSGYTAFLLSALELVENLRGDEPGNNQRADDDGVLPSVIASRGVEGSQGGTFDAAGVNLSDTPELR